MVGRCDRIELPAAARTPGPRDIILVTAEKPGESLVVAGAGVSERTVNQALARNPKYRDCVAVLPEHFNPVQKRYQLVTDIEIETARGQLLLRGRDRLTERQEAGLIAHMVYRERKSLADAQRYLDNPSGSRKRILHQPSEIEIPPYDHAFDRPIGPPGPPDISREVPSLEDLGRAPGLTRPPRPLPDIDFADYPIDPPGPPDINRESPF